jgi:hypothetical protein
MTDKREPWDRLPEENMRWFLRFKAFLNMPTRSRSVLAVYRKEREQAEAEQPAGARKGEKGRDKKEPRTFPRTWAEAKEKYRWQDRADAWELEEQRRLDLELAEQRKAELAEETRIAAELREKARAMLTLPIINEVVKRDREGNEIEFLLVPEFRAFKTASDMFGQAKGHALRGLGLPDRITESRLTGKDGGPVDVNNVSEPTDEDLLTEILELLRDTEEADDREQAVPSNTAGSGIVGEEETAFRP